MPIARTFLSWGRSALPAAAEHLIQRYAADGVVDLERVIVAFPGSRAGRRFLEVLVQRCDEQQWTLVPPQIRTVGQLPELLYDSKRPFASDFVQQLAWIHALRSEGRRKLQRIIPALPDEDDVPRWLDLGKLIWRQHRELAAEGRDFRDVVNLPWKKANAAEKNRWRLLGKIQQNYLQILDHFELWDLQTARLFAIEHRECRLHDDLILVGASDLNRSLKLMLDQVAERVTAVVFAPEKMADRFDRWGCLQSAAWLEAPLELRDDQLTAVENPSAQAEAVAAELAGYGGRFRADEIAIGITDPAAAPAIQRRLQQCRLNTRYVVGRPMSESAPFRLLSAIADYLDRGRFEDFAALVRHPDVDAWLDARCGGSHGRLEQLDRYYADHLPPKLGAWLGEPERHEAIRAAHAWIERLVEPLGSGRRKLAGWAPLLVDVVTEVLNGRALDRRLSTDHEVLAALTALQTALRQQQAAPEQLQPLVSATQAIRLLLDQLQHEQAAPPPDEEAVELLGWLELPLDTAAALIVTSFNEGCVPTSVNSDLFLPNRLRQQLGLLDNDRRYARDAYALSTLVASRKRLKLIVPRTNADGDPTAPSRLVFAADLATMGRRCQRFFQSPPPPRGDATDNAADGESRIFVPRPEPLDEPVRSMSVTSFRTYLACPYRFYLRHVRRLEPLDDAAEELDAPAFGNLLHDVLNQFGHSRLRDSDNADHIRSYLQDALRKRVRAQYGANHLAPVHVQLAQLNMRLDAFAVWQAEWRRQGWEIAHAEKPEAVDQAPLRVDDEVMMLRGRIDRIDRHASSGRLLVLDYKTGETGRKPEEAHQRSGEWIDLQLPLYRLFVRESGLTGELGYGYINLPKDTSEVGSQIAKWSEEEIDEAHQVAVQVARKVMAGEFWPPAEPPPTYLTEYSAICQDQAFEKRYAAEVEVV